MLKRRIDGSEPSHIKNVKSQNRIIFEEATIAKRIPKDIKLMKGVLERLPSDSHFVEVWRAFQGAEDRVRTVGRGADSRFKILEKICDQLTLGM